MPTPARPLFEDAVDIPPWLAADAAQPLAVRRARDRAHGRRSVGQVPLARVRAWWDGTRTGPDLGARLAAARRVLSGLLVAVSALAGAGFTAAVLRYDGSTPVNVVWAWSALVGLQLALLVPTVLLLVSGARALPALQAAIVALNPGALVARLYQRVTRLPRAARDFFGWHGGRAGAQAYARWQILYWSQSAALAFNLAALATACGLVGFTDLAFGWSTTLSLDARAMVELTALLAVPWRDLWPAALPSADLIEASRVFRLVQAAPADADPRLLTGWWPFLVASLACYGCAPRLLTWSVAAWQLRRATRALLLEDAAVEALLERLDAPEVALGARTPETAPPPAPRPAPVVGLQAHLPAAVIVWCGALAPDTVDATLARRAGLARHGAIHEAGDRTLADDAELLARLAAEQPAQVVVFTRAWEPPLLDCLDFLAALRAALTVTTPVIVMPLAADPVVAASADERATWQATIARLGDPCTGVEAGP